MTEIIKQPPIKFKRIFIHNLESRHLVAYPELFLENVEKEIFEPVKIKDQIVYQSKKIMTQNRKSYTEFECKVKVILYFGCLNLIVCMVLSHSNSV